MSNREGFIIDISRCTGCYACAVACRDRADLAGDVIWLRVPLEERGAYPAISFNYRPTHCWHCDDPACLPVCPVEAVTRNELDLVQIDTEVCIGCGACIEACPFGAVTLVAEVASKCDGCADELAAGLRPTCVRACPMRALEYGSLDVQLVQKKPDAAFDDHGIGPAVRYWVTR